MHHYRTRRHGRGARQASAEIRYRVLPKLDDTEITELDHFLSARWASAPPQPGSLWYASVDHER